MILPRAKQEALPAPMLACRLFHGTGMSFPEGCQHVLMCSCQSCAIYHHQPGVAANVCTSCHCSTQCTCLLGLPEGRQLAADPAVPASDKDPAASQPSGDLQPTSKGALPGTGQPEQPEEQAMDTELEADQARADKKQKGSGGKALTWPLKREARRLGPVHEYWQLPACVKVCFLSWLCGRSL